ncbi:hypothetical protein B566_EDAN016238 [Ephemera danica]|nr:hypothetical protein B566_EDAN016238 [Ephemera danica]
MSQLTWSRGDKRSPHLLKCIAAAVAAALELFSRYAPPSSYTVNMAAATSMLPSTSGTSTTQEVEIDEDTVDKFDGLPQSVCGLCVTKLDLSHNHALLAQKSDAWLQEIYSRRQMKGKPARKRKVNVSAVQASPTLFPTTMKTEEEEEMTVKLNPMDFLEQSSNIENDHSSSPVTIKLDPMDFMDQINSNDDDNNIPTSSEEGTPEKPVTFCTETREYLCNICNLSFSSTQNITTHVTEIHPELSNHIDYEIPTIAKCPSCQLYFLKNSNELISHCLKQHNQHLCTVCCTAFQSEVALIQHKKSVHSTKKRKYKSAHYYNARKKLLNAEGIVKERTDDSDVDKIKCTLCVKKFTKEEISDHYKRRHKKTVCPFCYDFSGYVTEVKAHCIRVHDEPLRKKRVHHLVCDTCGKVYTRLDSFSSHLKTHMPEESKFCCRICKKRFITIHRYNNHMMRHTGEKKNLCSICGKRFYNMNYLRIHTQEVHAEKNISCHYCDTKFKSQRSLQDHIKKRHETHWIYNCSVCEVAYRAEDDCVKHYREHSESEQRQATCKEPFYKTSEFGCEICVKYWGSRLAFQIHMKRRHGIGAKDLGNKEKIQLVMQSKMQTLQLFECDICPKKFTTKMQIRAHVAGHFEMRPFQCTFCGKTFNATANLNNHLKTHNV